MFAMGGCRGPFLNSKDVGKRMSATEKAVSVTAFRFTLALSVLKNLLLFYLQWRAYCFPFLSEDKLQLCLQCRIPIVLSAAKKSNNLALSAPEGIL